mgnify:CR=1 FL=1
MHTNNLEVKYKVLFWGMIFLFFGLTSSPTLVSGYHILIFIPTLLLFKDGHRFKFSKSSISLLALATWGLIATFYNHDTLIKPVKAYQDIKYYLFGVFCIASLGYYFKNAPLKHLQLLLKLLLFTIVVGLFVGRNTQKLLNKFDQNFERMGNWPKKNPVV